LISSSQEREIFLDETLIFIWVNICLPTCNI